MPVILRCRQLRSPRTVPDAVLTSGSGDQARTLSASGEQLLAILHTFPDMWRINPDSPSVVRIITFMVATLEVGDAVRVDQQSVDDRSSIPAPFRQAVLAEVAVHIT